MALDDVTIWEGKEGYAIVDKAQWQGLHQRCVELEAENQRLRHLVQHGFDVRRVVEWMDQDPRPRAHLAFTAGGERQAAYLVEIERLRCQQDPARLKALQELAELNQELGLYDPPPTAAST